MARASPSGELSCCAQSQQAVSALRVSIPDAISTARLQRPGGRAALTAGDKATGAQDATASPVSGAFILAGPSVYHHSASPSARA